MVQKSWRMYVNLSLMTSLLMKKVHQWFILCTSIWLWMTCGMISSPAEVISSPAEVKQILNFDHLTRTPLDLLSKWASTCLGCFHCFIDSFNDYFPGKEKKERNQTLMDGKVQRINGVSAETPIPLITPYKLGKLQLSHRCSLHLLSWFSPTFFHICCFYLLGVAGFWVFWGKDGMCGKIYVFGSWVMENF